MTDDMQTLTSLIERFEHLVGAVAGSHGSYRHCDHCERTTVWHINAVKGRYRCTSCQRGPS